MASTKNAGRRRFITRQHTSDTSEADATSAVISKVKTAEEEEECERRRLEKISLPRDTPSAFVRVAPSSSSSSSSKSANLDWTFRGSKNGLAVPSSSRRLPQHHHHQQQQQPSVPLNSELNNAPFHQLASEKIVQHQQQHQQPLIYATLETTSTGFPPDCDSLSLGFRPIRRDSLGSTSSSLAGSTVDSELTISNTAPQDQPFDSPQRIVKLPPHPTGKDLPDSSSSKLRPWSYYDGGGMLGPRTVLSSTGSASSYDNLDKMDSASNQKLQLNSDAMQVHLSPSPRFARTKHFDGGDPKRTPSPIRRHGSPFRSDDDRQFYVVGSRTHGGTSKETMSGEDRGEGPHFLDGVCRRRMAGGHVQVIPPHLVGVFDPSRFLPTSAVHAPSETNASGYVDVEKSVTKQPESTAYHPMGKLPSKLPVQPGYIRPSESSGKSLLPRVSGQHTSRDVADHSSSGHVNPTLPFASSKDSGLSMGETLSSASKVNSSRKSYRNDDLPAKDASPKFSDKRLFSTGRKGGSNVGNQEQQELSSVTDLFHHVLPNTDSSSHYSGGPVFKDTGPHYPHEQKDPQMSLTKPNAYLSTNHSSPSKQGSPKYAQTSTQKSSPKWESSISSRSGKKYEQTASPKTSPKIVPRHNNDQPKSSPKWERTSSAKSNLASSPKSSPKQERTAAGRRNLKWEAPSTITTSAKSSQQSSKSISKWEPPALSSKDNARSKVSSSLTAATGDHQLASFSGTSNLEKAEGAENERIVERTQYNRAVSDSGQSRSQSAIAESGRSQEKPRVSGDVSLTRTRSEREKRKTTGTQLAAVGAPDSVFSARRKQLSTTGHHDKVDQQSRTDVTVDRASRSRQNMDDGRDASMIGRVKPETGNSPSELKATLDVRRRRSNSPRKAADDAICPSDAASDRTSSTSSSLHGIENKGDAGERQRLQKSESGESDAHSTRSRSSAHSAEIVKVSLGDDAAREVTVMDVGGMESGSAAAGGGGDGGLDATLNDDAVNSNAAKDSVALKSTEDARVVSNGTGSPTVLVDDKEMNANVGDDGDLEGPRSKVRVSAACCPQTKTFTDILESIQVVTQPCGGGLTVSSSQETPGTTPVFGPPTSSSSAHFPLFDVNDEPVVKSSRGSLPDEVFALGPVDVSKKSLECITDQPSSVGQFKLSGEKSPGSCPVESAQRKTEQNADVVNNNLKETCPSTQTVCLEQPKISSRVLKERRSLDSISSSSLVELPTKELLADESSNVRTTAADPIYSVSVAQQLRYPTVVDKAIFTVDKEISFVSGLLEPDKRGSLPRKVSPQINLQNAGHMEYLKSESSPNAKLLKESESAPFMLVTVSSVSTDPVREAAPQSFSLGHVEKMPGAFQNPSSSNVHAFPTVQSTSHLNIADLCFNREKSPLSPIAALPSVFDCCPLSESLNLNESAILGNKNDDLVERDKVVSDLVERDKVVSNLVERDKVVSNLVERDKVVSNLVERDKVVSNSAERDKVVSDLDESDDETVDQGGNESKVSTASLDQLTQETEIFELAKTSAAYLKPEMTSTSSITFFPPVPPAGKTQESPHPAGKTQLIVSPSTFSKATLSQNNELAKRAFVFTSKESLPVNVTEQPAYPSLENRANASPLKSEVSPVMAALDDALAVLTSVVMETKTTSVDTLPRSPASSMPSKKDALKQDIEKVILSLNTNTKKPARSKITNKEGSSSSTKKRSGVVSHKEQQQQQQHVLFRSSPIATHHHSDPLEVMETVRQEIETVENRRRHRLSKDDSFNRPDSPMFHETLPLPKDSIIRRNREHCRDSSSSSDSGGSPQASPRLAPRNLRRSKRGQDTTSKSGSATTPLEMPGYRPFLGGHSSSGRTLSRHQSDIVLDMQSLPAGQHLHRTRRHNSDSADPGKGPWPKTVSLAQGMDTVTGQPAGAGAAGSGAGGSGAAGVRDGKRRTDRFPLPSDIQQSLLLYNQQHGGRRGQSWMQAVDASVEGTVFTGGPVHTKDRTG